MSACSRSAPNCFCVHTFTRTCCNCDVCLWCVGFICFASVSIASDTCLQRSLPVCLMRTACSTFMGASMGLLKCWEKSCGPSGVEFQVQGCFSSGERVQLIAGSRFAHETDACATLNQDVCPGRLHFTPITFEDNTDYTYQHIDLEICLEAGSPMLG